MALIKCKDCKKEFSTDAKACPHCGARKPSKGPVMILFLLSLLFFITMCNKLTAPPPAPQATAPVDKELSAAYACQRFVVKTLHDPKSAEFDNFNQYYTEKQKNGVYLVQVTLRARNGFGALRKTIIDCKVKDLGGDWQLVSTKQIN